MLPGLARVDRHAPDAEEPAAALLPLAVGVEAGLRSGTDGPDRFAVSPPGPRVRRVLAEVADPSAATAAACARALPGAVGTAHGRPVLLHGGEGGAWPVLRLAGRLGLAGRTGPADTLVLPDGRRACSNAELVAEGLRLHGHGDRSRSPSQQPQAPAVLLAGPAGRCGKGGEGGRRPSSPIAPAARAGTAVVSELRTKGESGQLAASGTHARGVAERPW